MSKVLEVESTLKAPSKHRSPLVSSCYCTKLSICLSLISLSIIFFLIQIQTLKAPSPFSSSSSPSWAFFHQWRDKVLNTSLNFDCSPELKSMVSKLRDSVMFLPLKDLRFAKTATEGHTWFMSSLKDITDDEKFKYLYFPSEASKGRLLCLMGRNIKDGGSNMYALAWPESLPHNATLRRGLTYVSDTYYDYNNLWHGLTTLLPFVRWYIKKGCVAPDRWVLYHWGELRLSVGPWVRKVMEVTFGGLHLEGLEGDGGGPICFEKALVFRHDTEEVNREEELEMLRCKARVFCNVSRGAPVKEIGLTLLLRRGARAFKNESAVVGIFEAVCRKVDGCRLTVAHTDNLTFCDQVKLMSSTDILATAHGAQMTNMIFMDRNSSLMQFFPKGWLELAGEGQYVYQWLASWSGMIYEGTWRDVEGEECPYAKQDLQCFVFYKDGKIGHNETFLMDWTMDVLNRVKKRKVEEASSNSIQPSGCRCG
ncbi:uncharacterized protein LOC143848047 [Tasmannia lanceolata]|uniref:uncharacterized protein LOC143848047 n=1 Tax=Tasmannia lanceolata TaxID=3420 RepID=UPI004062AF3E